MAATRLETENVRRILMDLMLDLPYFENEGKEAEKTLCYVAGAADMAREVIHAIEKLGGK